MYLMEKSFQLSRLTEGFEAFYTLADSLDRCGSRTYAKPELGLGSQLDASPLPPRFAYASEN